MERPCAAQCMMAGNGNGDTEGQAQKVQRHRKEAALTCEIL